MDWRQPYEQSMALFRYVDQGGCKPEKVEQYWHRAFSCVARHLGFNRPDTRILWEQLVSGNWKRLHQTDAERARTPEEWLDALGDELLYCSDRWSLDRLTRCHWIFRQYMYAATKKRWS